MRSLCFIKFTLLTQSGSQLHDSASLHRLSSIVDKFQNKKIGLANRHHNSQRIISGQHLGTGLYLYIFTFVFLLLVFSPVYIYLILSIKVPFMFTLQKNSSGILYCDINKAYVSEYFRANLIYIVLIMLIPLVTIFICNTLIIIKTAKDDTRRNALVRFVSTNDTDPVTESLIINTNLNRVIPHISNISNKIVQVSSKKRVSIRVYI